MRHFALVNKNNPAEFAAAVNNLLAQGYTFHGEMKVIIEPETATHHYQTNYIQAMINE